MVFFKLKNPNSKLKYNHLTNIYDEDAKYSSHIAPKKTNKCCCSLTNWLLIFATCKLNAYDEYDDQY